MQHAWTCRCCGKQFNTIQLDMAFKAPDHWFQMPEDERERIGKLGDDICSIERDIFIRGVIEIPINGVNDHFRWGTWVSVSEESFKRVIELWRAPVIEDEAPKFGWLCNNISIYPETLHLKTHVHLRGNNKRPSIELEPTDHPLAIEQRQGISMARVEEIVAACSTRH
jgi:hypothetical protein